MKKALIWLMAMLLLIIVATLGYIITLDVSFVNALYMTIITISTVGYREVANMNTTAKWFTMGVILISVALVGYLISSLFRFISEGNINESWRKNKMKKEIEKITNHIIVCGAGETGIHVIKQLKRRGASLVVIENDRKIIEKLKELNILYICQDATQEESLIEAQAKTAKGLITSLAKDADNVFIVLIARELNPEMHIVARAHEEYSHKKLIRAGANKTVSPNEIGGRKMASLMINPNFDYMDDNIIDTKDEAIELEEIIIKEESLLIGRKVNEAKISSKYGVVLLAIRREGHDVFIFNPKSNQVLKLDDKLIVAGSKEQIINIQKAANDLDV